MMESFDWGRSPADSYAPNESGIGVLVRELLSTTVPKSRMDLMDEIYGYRMLPTEAVDQSLEYLERHGIALPDNLGADRKVLRTSVLTKEQQFVPQAGDLYENLFWAFIPDEERGITWSHAYAIATGNTIEGISEPAKRMLKELYRVNFIQRVEGDLFIRNPKIGRYSPSPAVLTAL